MVSSGTMNTPDLIVCDLEATCWDDATSKDQMETIEIGAVRIRAGQAFNEFSSFIKPHVHPRLSEFCRNLTTIEQTDVDQAEPFSEVFDRFVQWMGNEPYIFCSWGRYDLGQLQLDASRAGLPWPSALNRHLNVKHAFAQWRQVSACGMERALKLAGLPLLGTHHRGIDDARNIAQLLLMMLPWLCEKNRFLFPPSLDSAPS